MFKLIELCQRLLESVRDVAPREPTPCNDLWMARRSKLTGVTLRHGNSSYRMDRARWCVIAGLSDVEGSGLGRCRWMSFSRRGRKPYYLRSREKSVAYSEPAASGKLSRL